MTHTSVDKVLMGTPVPDVSTAPRPSLHMFPRVGGGLGMYAPSLAVESFLRMRAIPHEVVYEFCADDYKKNAADKKAPKMPWVGVGSDIISKPPSVVFRELRKKLGIQPTPEEAALSAEAKSKATMLRRLVEGSIAEHLERYFVQDAPDFMVDQVIPTLPGPRWLVGCFVRCGAKADLDKRLKASDHARLNGDEYRDEFEADARALIGALDNGMKFAVTTDAPTDVDCSVFAFLESLNTMRSVPLQGSGAEPTEALRPVAVQLLLDSPVTQIYYGRLRELWFPDYPRLTETANDHLKAKGWWGCFKPRTELFSGKAAA